MIGRDLVSGLQQQKGITSGVTGWGWGCEGLGSQAVALLCGPDESGQEGQWGMGEDEVQEFGGMWLG